MMGTRNSEEMQIEGIKMLTVLLSLPSKESVHYDRKVKLRLQFEKCYGYQLMLSIFDNCRASVGLCNALMNLMIGKHAPQNVSQAGGKGGLTDDADIVTMINPGALQLILHVLKNSAF